MRVMLAHDACFPVAAYGGTERVIAWLAKGLAELGHEVILGCRAPSHSPHATVWYPDFSRPLAPQWKGPAPDVLHLFNTPSDTPPWPVVVTIEGNGRPGEKFLPNTVFVSRNHAQRHGAEAFVYNGLDPDDYSFSAAKDPYLLFLAKASWKVKNVRGAIRIARKARRPLRVLGGWRLWPGPWQGIHWEGMRGGERKRALLARAHALVFPVRWHEPFGIAVVEALVSGSPVIASPFGSLPELVTSEVGAVCGSEEAMVEALRGGRWDAEACRARALEHFHYRTMTESYLSAYGTVVAGGRLNPGEPVAKGSPEEGCELPGLAG